MEGDYTTVGLPLSAVPPARSPLVVANPWAVQAGLDVLKRGGSAVDAAVAAQAVLDLVEPQSLGLGGGFFTVVYDSATKSVTAYHGRNMAPAAATPELLYEVASPCRSSRRCSADARPREGQAQMH